MNLFCTPVNAKFLPVLLDQIETELGIDDYRPLPLDLYRDLNLSYMVCEVIEKDNCYLYEEAYIEEGAEIVTPNEFKRRVKSACGKGE